MTDRSRSAPSWTGAKAGRWSGMDGDACVVQGPRGFLCTRDPGHAGRHVATGCLGTLAFEAWPGDHEPEDADADRSTALVGPLRCVVFMPGTDAPICRWYDLPKDTRDPREASCFDHHPACDCREANTAEAFAEYRGELRDAQRINAAARAALLLHSRSRNRNRGWYAHHCVTCSEPFPCSTRVILREALWPYPSREDYPL